LDEVWPRGLDRRRLSAHLQGHDRPDFRDPGLHRKDLDLPHRPAHLRHWWNDTVTLNVVPAAISKKRKARPRQCAGVKAGQELRLSWAGPDWPIATEITIRLSGGDTNTRVALSHGGWSAFPEGDRDHLIEFHRKGWTRRLENLAAYAGGVN